MSDIRKCDGPNCEVEAPLADPLMMQSYEQIPAEQFITVECPSKGAAVHFHNQQCLARYYASGE